MATKKTTQSTDSPEENAGEEATNPTITPLASPMVQQEPTTMADDPTITLTLQRLKAGNHISIIEEGTIINNEAVGREFDPKAENVTPDKWVWVGNAEVFTPTSETEDDPSTRYDFDTLQWVTDKNTEVVSDGLKWTLLEYSQLISHLQYRPKGKFIDGESTMVYANSEPGIKCWVRVKKYNRGKQIAEQYVWGILKLDGDIEENNKAGKPSMVFEVIPSPHQDLTPDNGFGYSAPNP